MKKLSLKQRKLIEKESKKFAQIIAEIVVPDLKPTRESRMHETIQTTIVYAHGGFAGSASELCAAIAKFSGLPFKESRLFQFPIPVGKGLKALSEMYPGVYQQRRSNAERIWLISTEKVPPPVVPESRIPLNKISDLDRNYKGPLCPLEQKCVKKIEKEYNQPIKDVIRELAEVEELTVHEISTRLQLSVVTISRYCRKYGYRPDDLVY